MASLAGKTLFITGASRGIGREIALRAARDGARVVLAAKTSEPHAKLAGTIHTVALDVRDENAIAAAVAAAVERFGGIDILVNNASAISLTPTPATPAKRFDLMFGVNVRATFLCSQACIPHLRKSSNAHILTLSPPPSLQAKWFAPHLAYTMSKFGMSLCTLGLAEELRPDAIAVNSLWPATTIATAAIAVNFPPEILKASRHAAIVADAAHVILTSDGRANTGNFYLDEEVLRAAGVTDFSRYAVTPGVAPFKDLFVD
jgi:citronellol/citronellal dehydrogenase